MGVVRDITVEQLAQAVGGIDTSGLAKDTTLQATNTALGNINTTLGGITTNDPPTDTTQQSIASAISGLITAVKPDASDIPYDSTLSVKGKIDEVNDNINDNTCSITRQSGVSSSIPLPTITRRGHIVIIHFAQQFPAGTYYELYYVSPKPTSSEHAIVDIGSNKNVIYLSNDGKLRINNSITLSSAQYVIGQLVYLTDE